jgi:hypothetical protein
LPKESLKNTKRKIKTNRRPNMGKKRNSQLKKGISASSGMIEPANRQFQTMTGIRLNADTYR